MMLWFWRALAFGMVICLPVLLVTLNLRLVTHSPWLYEYGFAAYNAPAVTRLPMEELLSAARQTREYFNSPAEPLEVTVRRDGQPVTLYNQREIQHMADVKELFQAARRIEQYTSGFIVGFVGLGLWVLKRRFPPLMLDAAFLGGATTVVIILLGGLGALISFDSLFLQFHLLSFTNDLWLLDPRRDYLIMMYPAGFFRDATLAIAGLTLLEAAALAAGARWAMGRLPARITHNAVRM